MSLVLGSRVAGTSKFPLGVIFQNTQNVSLFVVQEVCHSASGESCFRVLGGFMVSRSSNKILLHGTKEIKKKKQKPNDQALLCGQG